MKEDNRSNPQDGGERGNDSKAALLLQERKKIIYNLVLLGTAVAVVIIGVLTMAWFSNNTKVNGTNMSVTVQGTNYEITMLAPGSDGIFKDWHDKVHDGNAMYWQMTASNNLINYNPYVDEDDPGDLGIRPGSWGVISFYVNPKVASVNLNFDIELIGYQSYTDDKETDTKEDDEIVMTALSDLEDHAGDIPLNLLNGHILFFENRTPVTVTDETTITYSKPILSNADMHRVLNRTIYSNDVTSQRIDIYWVWPNTLSTLVDARSYAGITTIPFCENDAENEDYSYTAIVKNIQDYPQYYLKGASSSDNIDAEAIAARYDIYGDMYDQGDNEIGMRVHYLMIRLTVTEGTAEGGGS
jgi:hypothetical protein